MREDKQTLLKPGKGSVPWRYFQGSLSFFFFFAFARSLCPGTDKPGLPGWQWQHLAGPTNKLRTVRVDFFYTTSYPVSFSLDDLYRPCGIHPASASSIRTPYGRVSNISNNLLHCTSDAIVCKLAPPTTPLKPGGT